MIKNAQKIDKKSTIRNEVKNGLKEFRQKCVSWKMGKPVLYCV